MRPASFTALAAAVVLACGGEPKSLELRVGLNPDSAGFGAVEVWGLPPSLRRALAEVPPQDSRWARVLAVKATSDGEDVPPLAGRYTVARGCVTFTPTFAPEGPLSYRIRLDRAELARLAGREVATDSVEQWSFKLPGRPVPPATTTITGVFPSGPVVPANQLRWYLEFSGPMREGQSASNVHLVDSDGREVDGSFLTVRQELWNPDRTRITLFFDMGRVKRAIRTRMEKGPVLKPGREYTLRVDDDWRDSRGAPLVRGMEHRFKAGPEDHEALTPSRWVIRPPRIGSRAPLTVDFGESLDHALAARLISVTGPDHSPLRGSVTLQENDRQWRFTPDAPWFPGIYQIRVAPALEDLAGNRVGHPFEADLRREERAGVDTLPATLEFSPIGELSLR